MAEETINRRPLKARKTAWASKIASVLVRLKIKPNTISILSIGFALLSGISFALSSFFDLWSKSILLILGAIFIQCRLLCNLFDGMVAIEGNMKSKSGEIFNDLPDRLADLLILVGIGYGLRELPFAVELGWLTGALAVMTAYVRYLGAAAGAGYFFEGPMAKPHRMAAATAAAVLQGVACFWYKQPYLLYAGLVIIAAGCVITVYRRTVRIVRNLERS